LLHSRKNKEKKYLYGYRRASSPIYVGRKRESAIASTRTPVSFASLTPLPPRKGISDRRGRVDALRAVTPHALVPAPPHINQKTTMSKYAKEIEREVQRIDELIKHSKNDDLFRLARTKLKELQHADHALKALVLVFDSKSLGQIEVPIEVD